MKHQKHATLFRSLGVCLLALCISFGAISVGSQPQAEAAAKPSLASMTKAYKAGKFKKGAKIAKKLSKKANEKCVKKMSSKMKKAYRKKVQSFNTNSRTSRPYIWDYYLTDINKDGKAELIVKYGSCEADVRMLVYRYSGGKAKKIGECSGFHATPYHYSNGILLYTAHMGVEYIDQVYVKNGKLKSKAIAARESQYGDYLITLPYALKSHVKYSADYSRRWMDLKDLK